MLHNKLETKTNKNGYEIRTEILSMAKEYLYQDYQAKFEEWNTNQKNIGLAAPKFPTSEDIIKTAHIFYGFVNANNSKQVNNF